MLPELIYREEQTENFPLLFALGAVASIIGFIAAELLFPTQSDVLAVIFAAIPLVYPLTRFFLEDEKNNAPHMDEIMVYGAIFAGEVAAFTALGFYMPEAFSIQNEIIGVTGYATNSVSFVGVLANNMIVYTSILAVASIIGSAGSFILTWNASVLGVFFGYLINQAQSTTALLGCTPTPSPLCYIPHASFEMTGFIVAGIAGSLISGALYREHFDLETWMDYLKLVLLGAVLVLMGAIVETT
ncbi:MAG: stage II sporulation protein M [Nanohaloarchaea archaeon]|nr:stage II sporulation protein M [Candidatus Nanohaloarchaea archaeon]